MYSGWGFLLIDIGRVCIQDGISIDPGKGLRPQSGMRLVVLAEEMVKVWKYWVTSRKYLRLDRSLVDRQG
jgi:hypothetical protein